MRAFLRSLGYLVRICAIVVLYVVCVLSALLFAGTAAGLSSPEWVNDLIPVIFTPAFSQPWIRLIIYSVITIASVWGQVSLIRRLP